jgi:hypothetical protein
MMLDTSDDDSNLDDPTVTTLPQKTKQQAPYYESTFNDDGDGVKVGIRLM